MKIHIRRSGILMATERQIAANRLNASRSSGPKTTEGKARSRTNAIKHGLAGESAVASSAAFEQRRAAWGDEYRPVGEAAGWALDRAVAASLRIEECERAVEEVAIASRQRATLAWDQDRAVEAASVASRLARDSVLISRQLQTSRAGAEWLVDAWSGLVAKLETGESWSETEASTALDLLGVASDLRSGRTLIDEEPGDDRLDHQRSLAFGEIDRLEALIEDSLGPLDEVDRRVAVGGGLALLSKPSKLILRYERDAWRRYRESIRQVQDPAASTPADAPGPGSVESVPNRPEERSARLEESARMELMAQVEEDEAAWLDDRERRVEAGWLDDEVRSFPVEGGSRASLGLVTERTRFALAEG